MGIQVPDKNCEGECRYSVGVEMTTCMYYPPVYDKNGNNINPDGNTTSGEMVCSTCNRKWKYWVQYGKYSYEELFPKDLTSSTMLGIIDSVDGDQGC